MELITEMLSTWDGILTVGIAAIMFFGIPAGVGIALMKEIKGPMETESQK